MKDDKKIKNIYDNNSISSLKGADRVRLRPGVIFGSDGIEGCQHSVFEILSNSIDEAREGYGGIINIILHSDNSVTIQDFGRGIPLDYNEKENKYNWELVFCEMYAGGKYNNNDGGSFEFSLGLNGLGACATQYASEYMDVIVYRDNYKFELHFEKGNNIGGLKKEKITNKNYINKTGTTIKYKPDKEVFTDINIDIQYFQNILKKQAIVNKGLKFVLINEKLQENNTFEYYYENGISDYIKEINKDKSISDIQYYQTNGIGKDREDKPEYKVKLELSFCFNNEINLLEYYHNSSFLEYGGSPDKAVKNAFVYTIDKFLKERNKYNKDENKITFTDIQDSLIFISNSFSTVTSYENQTKKSITNKFIQDYMTEYLKQQLEIYFVENKLDSERILEQILINKRSRESAEKARINIKKKLSGNIDISNRVKKYIDCRTKDISKREIYIVEGDSALGSCKLGRDAEFQAIIPVRGKILNCLKAEYDNIFKNEIIVDLLKVLGCGIEVKSKHNKDLNTFDINNLKFDKVIICTDGDVDGFQIRTLILAMIYRLTPSLIDMGKVYIAESPLFEINTGSKNKSHFAYSEKEKNDIINKIKKQDKNAKITIQRSKGLGENEPEMMWETTMNPDTRRLIKIVKEDINKMNEMFELLLGDNLQGRKNFIEENGHKYLDMIDVN